MDSFIKDYEVSDGWYAPISLHTRFTMRLKSTFGTRELVKEFMNVMEKDYCSGREATTSDNTQVTIASLQVLTVVSGKITICPLELDWTCTKFCVTIKGKRYDIISVDDNNPFFYAPHLVEMGIAKQ
jgi:hypothetical protein